MIKDVAATLRDLRLLAAGWREFARTGTTPEPAYFGLIRLFCRTRGLSNDLLHSLVRLFVRKQPTIGTGVLGSANSPAIRAMADDIRADGFRVFDRQPSGQQCDALLEIGDRLSATPVGRRDAAPEERVVYDREKPIADVYQFAEIELIQEGPIQELMADESLIALAQEYLGCEPILSIVAMWWSTAHSSVANAAAAQLYHFDMDRIKWLKIFCYVTDVSPENGPHVFVRGTHRHGSQPPGLLSKGYARLSDAEVEAHYTKDRIAVFVGPRGTMFAEDTRGFHKGLKVERGHRLIAELEFCDSLFGGAYQQCTVRHPSDALAKTMQRFPRTFVKYR